MDYIYYLQDPKEPKCGYVGKSNKPKNRFRGHILEAERNKSSRKDKWIIGLKALNLEPVLVILEEVNGDWKERERYWIDNFKKLGYDLFNMMPGGCGSDEVDFTEEQRLARSELMRLRYIEDPDLRIRQANTMRSRLQNEPELYEKYYNHLRDIRQDIEISQRHRASLKARFKNPVVLEEYQRSSTQRWQDPEYRQRVSDGLKLAYQDEEVRKNCSETKKRMWQDPEYRDKVIKNSAAAISSPEGRAIRSKTMKKKFENPEFREKMKAIRTSKEFRDNLSKKAAARFRDPAMRLKYSEAKKKKLQDNPQERQRLIDLARDPELRKKNSERMKAMWAERRKKKEESQ